MISRSKKSVRLLVVFFLSAFLPFSCIEQLEDSEATREVQLVIYGLLTDTSERQVVSITRTSALGLATMEVRDAKVSLLTDSGDRFRYSSSGIGDYFLEGFAAIEGESYAIEVVLEDKVYLSTYEKLPELLGDDKIGFEFNKEPFRTESPESVFTVTTETTLPISEDPIYLRWTVEETYFWPLLYLPGTGFPPPPPPPCFISDVIEPNRINLFDGSSTSTRKGNFVLGKRLVDNSFLYPFFVSVKQLSINREAYEYWEKIKIMVTNQGSLFDIPPAPVIGNISNVEDQNELVLGYFEVAKAKVTRIYTTRADVPYSLVDPCRYFPNIPEDSYPSECKSCDERAQGRRWTNTAPDWWNFD